MRGLHLIKDGIVALSDASPLSLPGDSQLDNWLDVYAWQLPALDDTHTNLDKKLFIRDKILINLSLNEALCE